MKLTFSQCWFAVNFGLFVAALTTQFIKFVVLPWLGIDRLIALGLILSVVVGAGLSIYADQGKKQAKIVAASIAIATIGFILGVV